MIVTHAKPYKPRISTTKPFKRAAISFYDPKVYEYYSKLAKLRGEAFSAAVEGILSSVAADDMATEEKNAVNKSKPVKSIKKG